MALIEAVSAQEQLAFVRVCVCVYVYMVDGGVRATSVGGGQTVDGGPDVTSRLSSV